MPFVKLAFVRWQNFTRLCSPTMRYPWRSRTSCFWGSISSGHDAGGLKGFRDAGSHEIRACRRRRSQCEQLDVARMERHGVERTALRLNRLEAIAVCGGNEGSDTVRDASMSERRCDVSCEDRLGS